MEDRNKYILGVVLVAIVFLVLIASLTQWIIIDFVLVGIGIMGGVFVSYLMYLNFTGSQEEVVLADNEEIKLDASGSKSHLMIRKVGEEKPQSVVEVNLYMTNLGIIAKDRVKKNLVLYIPLDRITMADLEGKGIKIEYVDDYTGNLNEVLLHVGEGFDEWVNELYQYLSAKERQMQQQQNQ